jgi:cytidyltransferase-like protein
MENKQAKKIGFTIGKFAPFHKGHQYLIETALKEMDELIVVVYDTDVIQIPTEKRANWIKSIYPNVEIKYAHNPPSQYGLDEESVKIQMEYLTNILKDKEVTHFYSSESYGKYVAKYMNIIDRRVDSSRNSVPISATELRKNIELNKKWIDEKVYFDCLENQIIK